MATATAQRTKLGLRPRVGRGDAATFVAAALALVIVGATLVLIAGFLLREALPALEGFGGTRLLLTDPWSPLAKPPRFGLFHAWVSSLMITGLALAVAVPIGYGMALFLAEIAPPRVSAALQPSLDLLAGIPAVVYGFVGYVVLLPWIEITFDLPTGESVLAAGLVLSAMILPYIVSLSAEAFRAVPGELREAALSQGVTRFHMVRRIVLPRAASGAYAAVALALARALGETLAVLMLAGNVTRVPSSLLDRAQPLTALIATELGEAGVGSPKYHALFVGGLVLLALIMAVNAGIWVVRRRWIGP